MSGIEIAVAALSAVGSIAGAAGAAQAGQARADALNYQAQVAANNAKIQQQNAEWAKQTGAAKVAAQDLKTRAAVGAIKASQAASGVDVNSPSSVDVRASQTELGELDSLTLKSNAARTVYGYEVAGQSQEAQAGLDRMAANDAAEAGTMGAFTSLLSGATSALGSYGKWQAAGGTSATFL